jgi:HK97 family phage major capsid protein
MNYEVKNAGDLDVKSVIEETGKTFEAFKKTMDELQGEVKKLGGQDVVTAEKLNKIEGSLDRVVEQKAAFEAALAAEKKEREELEIRLNRHQIKGDGEAAKLELEVKEFNNTLKSYNPNGFAPLDAKHYVEYQNAYNSFLRKNERLLTAEEIKTLQVGSDPDGGYLVTPNMSSKIIKKVYESSPMRQVCDVVTISTDAIEGMEDLGEAGAGYAGEKSTSGDTTTPQLGKWRIQVYTIDTEPKITQQLLDDAAWNVETWLSGKVGDKFARFTTNEYITGAANKIRGLFSGYTMNEDSGSGVTWGTFGFVKSGANGDFAASTPADKLLDLMGMLKNEYLGNARWMTRRSVIQKIRKFKDGQNLYLWQPSLQVGQPEMLLGFPIVRAEDVPTLATDSYSLAFGDFRQAYMIVDRQGLRTLRDPYTAKPFVKFYTTMRTGGGAQNYEAVKFMKFAA